MPTLAGHSWTTLPVAHNLTITATTYMAKLELTFSHKPQKASKGLKQSDEPPRSSLLQTQTNKNTILNNHLGAGIHQAMQLMQEPLSPYPGDRITLFL